MNGVKIAAIAAGISLVAVGAAAPFTDLPVRAFGAMPDVLSMLHKRSPEERPEGALVASKGRVSAVLPTAVEAAPPPKVASLAPAAKPAVVPHVIPETPMVLPAAVVPAVASALPLASAAPAAAGGLFIPPLVIPGGGGGGGITTLVTPPGAAPPPAVPGVPEPATWAMMIIGFGMVGGLLRRRRRIAGAPDAATADRSALAS
jgi:hypothetical protein